MGIIIIIKKKNKKCNIFNNKVFDVFLFLFFFLIYGLSTHLIKNIGTKKNIYLFPRKD